MDTKSIVSKELPSTEQKMKELPQATMESKELPKAGNVENMVVIGGKEIEIKPTKVKYHRNNTAYFYRVVDNVPLPDIMSFPVGTFGDDRDGDKALMDWLIAVTDDPDLIIENYDNMDTETIEQMLAIFKRVNKIDEKEAKQKNGQSREAKESRLNEESQ